MFTDRQQRTLAAVCRRIVPASGDTGVDLPAAIALRLGAAAPFHRQRFRQALDTLGNPGFIFFVTGRLRGFAELSDRQQDAVLRRCEGSSLGVLRLLFNGVKRLVANTYYSLPPSHGELRYTPNLQSPIEQAGPVVAARARDRVRTRVVPSGVTESIERDTDIATEFCVIGSGVGGAVAACTLSEAGRAVVMLEAGPYRAAADYSTTEYEAVTDLYADAALRTSDDLSISILQGRCAGGGSTINWMVMLRTPDHVLEEWARAHYVQDMSPRQMHAVFERFEHETGVGLVAEHAHSRTNRILLDGARKLGWRAHSACINARECLRVGLCGLGCPYDAKLGMLKTHIARALAAGARMYCNVQAHHVASTGGKHLVHAVARDGARITIRADRIIVAAGAVETPALLQRSGIGNHNVGRFLRLHPTTAVVGVYEEPVDGSSGIPLTTYCNEFAQMRDGYGHWIETPPLTPGLASIALPGFGERHRNRMREFPYFAPLIVLVRDGAPGDPSHGRVRWQRDRPRIDFRLSRADRATLVHGMESAARIHFAMGARSVFTLHGANVQLRGEVDLVKIGGATSKGDPILFSAHVNGTCRIGSRASGVCAPDGSVHGAPGIYVMDGSLLPTAPGVNPHETIAGVVSVLSSKLLA
jgi:choline dehydrogenase-like flavoprotein